MYYLNMKVCGEWILHGRYGELTAAFSDVNILKNQSYIENLKIVEDLFWEITVIWDWKKDEIHDWMTEGF